MTILNMGMPEKFSKIWKIVAVLGVILLFAFSLAWVFSGTSTQQGGNMHTMTISTPQGEVTIRNVYESPVEQTEQAVVPLETESFKIVYFPEDEAFLITLLAKPLNVSQSQAEAAFLKNLGIKEQDACKLKVSVTVPAFVDQAASGKNYGLSFCGEPAF